MVPGIALIGWRERGRKWMTVNRNRKRRKRKMTLFFNTFISSILNFIIANNIFVKKNRGSELLFFLSHYSGAYSRLTGEERREYNQSSFKRQ